MSLYALFTVLALLLDLNSDYGHDVLVNDLQFTIFLIQLLVKGHIQLLTVFYSVFLTQTHKFIFLMRVFTLSIGKVCLVYS